MTLFREGDRFIIPEDDTGIDPQFRGQTGTVIRHLPHYTGGSDHYYDVQFDIVPPPFRKKPYGDDNYWRVAEDSMEPTASIELTPEGIEAFLNA